MKQNIIQTVAQTIIDELEAFEKGFQPQTNFEYSDNKIIDEAIAATKKAQEFLQHEPFIAYVKAEVNGEEKVYFVCRNQTPLRYQPFFANAQFVSHKAPLGRIAALDAGDDDVIKTPQGKCAVTILEKNIFKPRRNVNWDGIDNQISTFRWDEKLDSLRTIYQKTEKNVGETVTAVVELPKIVIEEEKPDVRAEYLKRISARIARNFALRDRPILDRTQDEIFRLPLNSQIILTGAPGTGKTTVLIRRLAQKSQPSFIADEIEHLTDEQKAKLFSPSVNWMIFTPNELLKSYLKESLNKENLPAGSTHVKIWKDYKSQIASQYLQILRVANRGLFIRTTKPLLAYKKNSDLTSYFYHFEKFYCDRTEKRLKKSLQNLSESQKHKFFQQPEYADLHNSFVEIADRLSRIYNSYFIRVGQTNTESFPNIFGSLANIGASGRNLLKQINQHIADIVRRAAQSTPAVYRIVEEAVKTTEKFSDEKDLQRKTLQKLWQVLLWSHQGASKATLAALQNPEAELSDEKNTLKALAKEISPLFSNETKEIFFRLLFPLADVRRALRDLEWATSGYSKVVELAPRIYDDFRLTQIEQKRFKWFAAEDAKDIREKRISAHELDALIYFMLREVRHIFRGEPALLQTDANNELLENVKSLYRTQIIVDEATDFSALELGAMYSLSHPQFESVFLAGDLMQRVTANGLQSWDECKFFTNRFRRSNLVKTYRQSPRLVSVAARLYEKIIGELAGFDSAFAGDAAADPTPLVYQPKNKEQLASWLSERIVEIVELNNHQLPSVAVFVPREEQIDELYNLLEEPLNQNSISVEKCRDGQVLGSDAKVRIFSVEHIKGLEFGAVFLVNIDEINSEHPGMIDKYLYVALTRATTFLGITHTKAFPRQLAAVKDAFEPTNWAVKVPNI